MKSILRISAAAVALASVGFASSASAATATANAEAEILTSLTVTLDATNDLLDFGSIAESGSGGTVDVAATTGTITCSVGLICDATGMSPNFDLVGEPGLNVGISFTDPTINLSGPGTDMVAALSLSAATVALDGTTGLGTFDVGGTLSVGANQASGTYTGQLEVVALYQ